MAVFFFVLVSASPAYFSVSDSGSIEQESQKKLLKRARKQLRKGLLNDSADTINKVLTLNPENNEAKLDLAYVYLKQRKLVKALQLSYDIAKEDPTNSYAFAIVGSISLATGEFREARILLENSLILNKRTALAWASLGMLDFYENRVREGILNLQEAVYHDRREPDFEFALAQVSARGERYKEAAKAYKRFLRIAPKAEKERRDRIKGLIAFLDFLGSRTSIYDLGGEDKTTVKTQIINNRPIVPLRLKKGGEVLNFVLDTGSGITVISEETAKRFKIRSVAKGGLARALGGSGKFKIVYGFLDSMRIGDVRVRNVPVYIREFQDSGTKVDGYIGLSVISKYITTLDYGNETLSLERKNKAEEDTPLPNEAQSIPLRLTSSGFLSGNVKLSGVENDLNFILDTGASLSVVSNDLADTDPLKPLLLDQRMRVIGAAGITDNVPMYLLKGVDFGGFSRPNLMAVALDLDIINETSGFVQAGILGGNFLKDYKLTFDFERSRVTLIPN